MDYRPTTNSQKLIDFITSQTEPWRNHRDVNFLEKWRTYERAYRGVFRDEDKLRSSERSTIVTPITAQAVDTRVSELSEATMSTDEFFDIEDDVEDKNPIDTEQMKNKLAQNFKKDKIKRKLQQVLKMGEIYGTGIGEIVTSEGIEQAPAKRPSGAPGLAEVGVVKSKRLVVDLYPVVPMNFLIDPLALDIDDSLGVAVEEYTPTYKVMELIERKEYRPCNLSSVTQGDTRLDKTDIETQGDSTKIRVMRYYGKVPKNLLENIDKDDEPKDPLDSALEELKGSDMEQYAEMVEAIVVIGDGAHLLKAVKTPYMMGDRPVVCYRPDIEEGRFWGRGTAEKGIQMQRAIDGQVRAHLDSVAITAAPMVGIDATKMPRGFKFHVQAGRSVLTQGNPAEAISPLKLGEPSPVNIETAQLFERMHQQATGTIDSAGMPGQVNNQTNSGALSMALSGIIKKNKVALLNFQEEFLIPFIRKAAWRYMQFDPDNFPVSDYNFLPVTTMGIMAREYEQQQYMAMLSTLGPDSPLVPMILTGIVQNSSISNKEQLVQQLVQMSQPNPEQQQMQQMQMQMQMRAANADIQEKEAKAQSYMADAEKKKVEAQIAPLEAKVKLVAAMSNNLDDENEGKDFERRAKITEMMLKEKDLALKERDILSNEKIAQMQMGTKLKEVQTKAVVEKMKMERDDKGNLTVTKERG